MSTAAPPLFGPYLLWPNGWMDQGATWYGDRPQPRPHCARWRPSSPTERGTAAPTFRPCLLWPNGCPSQQLLSSFSFNTHCWFVGWLDEVLMVLFLTQCDVVLNEFLPVRRYAIVGGVAKLKMSYGRVSVCLSHAGIVSEWLYL